MLNGVDDASYGKRDNPVFADTKIGTVPMKIDRLIMLLPCSSLDDLRLDRNLDEATELLSGWSALWHPALIHSAQGVPSWFPATQPPQYPKDYVIVLADCCRSLLPDGWLAEAEAYGAVVLQKLKNRAEVVDAALKRSRKRFASQSSRIWRPISLPWVIAGWLSNF